MEEKIIASNIVKVSVIQKSFKNTDGNVVEYARIRLHGKSVDLDLKLEDSNFYASAALLLNEITMKSANKPNEQ